MHDEDRVYRVVAFGIAAWLLWTVCIVGFHVSSAALVHQCAIVILIASYFGWVTLTRQWWPDSVVAFAGYILVAGILVFFPIPWGDLIGNPSDTPHSIIPLLLWGAGGALLVIHLVCKASCSLADHKGAVVESVDADNEDIMKRASSNNAELRRLARFGVAIAIMSWFVLADVVAMLGLNVSASLLRYSIIIVVSLFFAIEVYTERDRRNAFAAVAGYFIVGTALLFSPFLSLFFEPDAPVVHDWYAEKVFRVLWVLGGTILLAKVSFRSIGKGHSGRTPN